MTGGARFPFTTLMTWGLGAPDSGAIVELKKEAKTLFIQCHSLKRNNFLIDYGGDGLLYC